jgi:predicted type IV restriction endonuclease
MALKEHINDIRKRLEQNIFKSETAVRQGIVDPLLRSLGWPTDDTLVVFPEYPVGSGHVDYALCHPSSTPRVFIEAKQVGNIKGAEEQLFGYDSRIRVPIAVLTDGREWQFFHPTGEGTWAERKVCEFDLTAGDSEENAEKLNRYLNYESIRTGEAVEAIKKDYEKVVQQRQVATRLPEAWIKLVEEADEFLLDVVAEKVESLCGYKPTNEQVLDFLKSLERFEFHEKAVHSSPVKMDNTPKRIHKGYVKEDGSAEWTTHGKRRVVNAAIVAEMQRAYYESVERGDGTVEYPMGVLVKYGIVENTNYDKDGNWTAVAKIVGHERKTESHLKEVPPSLASKPFSTSLNQKSQTQSKTPPKRLAVTMLDGEIIRCHKAMDTFREVIFKLGPEKVLRVDKERMLISTEPIPKRRTVPYRGYHITGNHGTPVKRDLLERIAERLRVRLRIEIVD